MYSYQVYIHTCNSLYIEEMTEFSKQLNIMCGCCTVKFFGDKILANFGEFKQFVPINTTFKISMINNKVSFFHQ